MTKEKGTVFTGTGAECVDFVNFAQASEETDFVRVAPYGDAPQFTDGREVIQRFDFASAKKIVDGFKRGFKAICKRAVGKNHVPFFFGHPDFANASASDEGRDTTVYAEATDLDARADGLYARIKRTPLLDKLKEYAGKLEISPRWNCEFDAMDGTFKPFELLSFGLVKKGNLTGADFINSEQAVPVDYSDAPAITLAPEQVASICTAFGIPPKDLEASTIVDAVLALVPVKEREQGQEAVPAQEEGTEQEDAPISEETKETENSEENEMNADETKEEEKKNLNASEETKEEAPAVPAKEETEPAQEKDAEKPVPAKEEEKEEEAEETKDGNEGEKEEKKKKLDAVNEELASVRAELAEMLVSRARIAGKITPAQADEFTAKFATDFANARAELDALPSLAKEFSNEATQALDKASESDADHRAASDKWSAMINARIDAGDDYAHAVANVYNSQEGRDVYNALEKATPRK